ncbi:MAG TPA: RES family NAD+ phosphorylase [Gaiellaceae bacterium]|nr:RES family NAD+ phosphorylase [Gaiellaceae bacterium]
MILHRCFAWDPRAGAAAPGGALWFPRPLQGEGRHDAPERFGCLYVSEEPLSAVVEELARFGGASLAAADLRRGGLPLALAELRLADTAPILDLDSPRVLAAAGLRPSLVATGERELTQAVAEGLHARLEEVAGLRWSSALESRWANLTLYDRARDLLTVEAVRALGLEDEVVQAAAGYLGLRPAA